MSGLNLNELRAHNLARLPQFKNSLGQPAHSKPDGSDWNPSQWLQAMFGEVGEFARARLDYEQGRLTWHEYKIQAEKELADIQTYLDLLSARALDKLREDNDAYAQHGPAYTLMNVIADMGDYANARKKFDRGDYDRTRFSDERIRYLSRVPGALRILSYIEHTKDAPVAEAHPTGVDLASATIAKFNEVSERVGSSVRMAYAVDFDEPTL